MTAPFLSQEVIAARVAAERETRVECLEPGDRFRWVGGWYTVNRQRSTALLRGRQVAVETVADRPEDRLVFLFPTGHMVAAECPR